MSVKFSAKCLTLPVELQETSALFLLTELAQPLSFQDESRIVS